MVVLKFSVVWFCLNWLMTPLLACVVTALCPNFHRASSAWLEPFFLFHCCLICLCCLAIPNTFVSDKPCVNCSLSFNFLSLSPTSNLLCTWSFHPCTNNELEVISSVYRTLLVSCLHFAATLILYCLPFAASNETLFAHVSCYISWWNIHQTYESTYESQWPFPELLWQSP